MSEVAAGPVVATVAAKAAKPAPLISARRVGAAYEDVLEPPVILAGRTSAVTVFIPAELIGAPGGDLVPASIITGRVARTARTQVHYGAVSHDTVVMSYGAAVESIDPLSHHQFPGEAIVAHLGDKRTPTDLTVRTLIADLARPLDDTSLDAAERHLAMMRYTVALLTFALAHRGNRSALPSFHSVHAETRFCWISDKAAGGQASRRLVWVCDTALDQLRRYDEHLDALQDEVSPAAAQAIAHLRRDRQLAIFDLTRGAVERWPVTKACRDALGSAGLPNNTGRHWLRSRLVGRCSTETLHAFYGHGPIEEGSWDSASTLDPAVYRADLARVLDPALIEIGWRSRRLSTEATAS